MIKKILRPTTVISCRTMQEDWEGFDFLIFSIFFNLFFGAPSCRLYSPLQVGLNIFGFSDLPRIFPCKTCFLILLKCNKDYFYISNYNVWVRKQSFVLFDELLGLYSNQFLFSNRVDGRYDKIMIDYKHHSENPWYVRSAWSQTHPNRKRNIVPDFIVY